MTWLRNINPPRVCLGALVCLASLACFSGVVSPSIVIVTVAIEVALWWLHRTAAPRPARHFTPFREPVTGMH